MSKNTIKRIELRGITIVAQHPNNIYGTRDENRLNIYINTELKKDVYRARRHVTRMLRAGIASNKYKASRGKVIEHHHGTWIDYSTRLTVRFVD